MKARVPGGLLCSVTHVSDIGTCVSYEALHHSTTHSTGAVFEQEQRSRNNGFLVIQMFMQNVEILQWQNRKNNVPTMI